MLKKVNMKFCDKSFVNILKIVQTNILTETRQHFDTVIKLAN